MLSVLTAVSEVFVLTEVPVFSEIYILLMYLF